jgi:hypothetical protein
MLQRIARRRVTPSSRLGVLAGLIPLIFFVSTVTAHAQEDEKPPMVVPASGRSIKLEGQVQVQASSSSVDSVVDFDAELRRMRVTLDGDAGNGFSGRLMADFDSNRARIRDAFVDVPLGTAVKLRIGQFKTPFNAIELESSKRLLLIERGNRIRGTALRSVSNFLADAHYSARNRGIMAIAGTGGRWTLQAGTWLGSGEAGENDDGKEVAARLEVRPLGEDAIPLVLAAAAAANGFYGPPRDTLRTVGGTTVRIDDPIYGKAFELSAEIGAYGRPGIHALAGYFAGDKPFVLVTGGGEADLASFDAWHEWGEYRIETGHVVLIAIGPAARFDWLDPDTDVDDDAVLFSTVGVNLYFGRPFKLQVNWERIDREGDGDDESAFRIQTQLVY